MRKCIATTIFLMAGISPLSSMASVHWHVGKDGKISGGLDAIKSLSCDAFRSPWNSNPCEKKG